VPGHAKKGPHRNHGDESSRNDSHTSASHEHNSSHPTTRRQLRSDILAWALTQRVPRSIEGGFLVLEPLPHGASPAPRRPVLRCRQADGNRPHALSEAVPRTRRSLPHGGRTKVVVS
jgi:hypothetical protein